MLNEEYGWSLIRWLLSGMFTTIFSGAGFVFITVAVEYAKEYNRKRIAKERKVRRLFHRNLERSPVHSIVCTRVSKRRYCKLNRKASLFDAYKQSHAFLGNTYRRPRPRVDANQQDTPISNSDYVVGFSDDQDISGSPHLNYALNSDRMRNFNGANMVSPILISRHNYNKTLKENALDQQGHVTSGYPESYQSSLLHSLSIARPNPECSDKKTLSLTDSDIKPLTYCEECHRSLTQCAFIKAATTPTVTKVSKVNSAQIDAFQTGEAQTRTQSTSMELSFDPLSPITAHSKDCLNGRGKGDIYERTKMQARRVRRWNSCIKPEQVRRLFKGASLNEIDKRAKGKAVMESIANITAIDHPERKMAEFGGMNRSQYYFEKTPKTIKWVTQNDKYNDKNSSEGLKDHCFVKEGPEKTVRQKMNTSAVPDFKHAKQIPADKVILKSIKKSATLSESNLTRNIPLRNKNTMGSDKNISKDNQSQMAQRVSSFNDIDKDLQKQQIIQEHSRTDKTKISQSVFIEIDNTLDSHRINNSDNLTLSETGNGDHSHDRKQSTTLELEDAQVLVSHTPLDGSTKVKKSRNNKEQNSPTVTVGPGQTIVTCSNRSQSLSRGVDKISTEKNIAIKQKRPTCFGLNEEYPQKNIYQIIRPVDDSHNTPQSNKKTNAIDKTKRHVPSEKMIETRKSTSNRAKFNKVIVKKEKQFSNVHELSKGSFTKHYTAKPRINTYKRHCSTNQLIGVSTPESKQEFKGTVETSTKVHSSGGNKSKSYVQCKRRSPGRTRPINVFRPNKSKRGSKEDVLTSVRVNEKNKCPRSILRKSRLDAVVQEMEKRKTMRQIERTDHSKSKEDKNNLNPHAPVLVGNQDDITESSESIFNVASGANHLSVTRDIHEIETTPTVYYAPMYGIKDFFRMVGFGQEGAGNG